MSNILVINGSPSGSKGNSQKLIEILVKFFPESHNVKQLVLSEEKSEELWEQLCRDAKYYGSFYTTPGWFCLLPACKSS